jgi:deazaflavin-dependent oxidoreductase (nitroreductase family)
VSDTSVAVLASNYGAARHPGWYHNLIAQPSAVVEIDGDWWTVTARVAPPAERALLIDRIARSSAAVTTAISRTSRQIPVVVLELVARRREAGTDSMTRSTSSRSAAGSG